MIYGIIVLFWKDNENCLPFLWSKLGESNKKQVEFKMIFILAVTSVCTTSCGAYEA